MIKKPDITLVEVGPRDGLQNSPLLLSFQQKKEFISYLLQLGFTDVEAGSFVKPDRLPAMADTPQIADHFKNENSKLWYLAPNLKGVQAALSHSIQQLAFFTATSDTFNKKNIGMGVKESLEGIKTCLSFLKDQGYSFITQWDQKPTQPKEIKLRLYISTVIGCPYQGAMAPDQTLSILDEMMPLGFAQASLGDTIGVGVPSNWRKLLSQADQKLIEENKLALHCHDTYATALACVAEGLSQGIRTFDSSLGGLGGCPYASGATGNLATEDLLYFLEKEGFKTGVSLEDVLKTFTPSRTGNFINTSKVAKALSSRGVSNHNSGS